MIHYCTIIFVVVQFCIVNAVAFTSTLTQTVMVDYQKKLKVLVYYQYIRQFVCLKKINPVFFDSMSQHILNCSLCFLQFGL
jgi:hypothetical protein